MGCPFIFRVPCWVIVCWVLVEASPSITFDEYLNMTNTIGKGTVSLDAHKSRISAVEFTTPFSDLTVLDLSGNLLTAFPTSQANFTSKLRRLHLSGNHIQDLDSIPSGGHFDIHDLYLGSNLLEDFPDLRNLTDLRRLYLMGNFMKHVRSERLDTIGEHLEVLDLSHNPIIAFEDATVPKSIEYAKFNALNVSSFPHLPNLLHRVIVWLLEENENFMDIDYIDDYQFIEELSLAGCRFGGVLPDFFNISDTLEDLDLTETQLRDLPPERLAAFQVLEHLELNSNPLTEIPDVPLNTARLEITTRGVQLSTFPILPHTGPTIRLLELSYNNFTIDYIGHLDTITPLNMKHCNYGGFFPDLYNISTTLLALELSDNGITYIDPDYLNDLVKLKTLRLYNNPISVFPDVPGPSNTLEIIVLSNATLDEFPNLVYLGQNIEELHIDGYYQSYTDIPTERMRLLPKLQFLNVDRTSVLSLPDFTRLDYPRPPTVSMREMVVTCDQNALMIKLAILNQKLSLENDVYPQCDDLGIVKDTSLKSVDLKSFAQGVTKAANKITSTSRRLDDPGTFTGFTGITKVHEGFPRGACAIRCMLHADCIMFGVEGTSCAITGSDKGSQADSLAYGEWYILD